MSKRRAHHLRNPRYRQLLGGAAEELAARHLEARGCRVLARRYRTRRGEVDLVVLQPPAVVFVEVKARRGGRFGAPVEAVTPAKCRRLVAVAGAFLRHHGLEGAPCRFDVVSVQLVGGRARVRWLRDAFRP